MNLSLFMDIHTKIPASNGYKISKQYSETATTRSDDPENEYADIYTLINEWEKLDDERVSEFSDKEMLCVRAYRLTDKHNNLYVQLSPETKYARFGDIKQIVDFIRENEKQITDYEKQYSNLLEFIRMKEKSIVIDCNREILTNLTQKMDEVMRELSKISAE